MEGLVDSILTSIKKLLGIQDSYTHFDPDIIMDINTAFGILTQIGIGPTTGFSIIDSTAEWTDFVDDIRHVELIRSYIHLKVKLLFDPPLSSSLIEVINRQISELEWRISITVNGGA